MAKRFTDTDKWKRKWFCELDHKAKIVWFYLLDMCDHRGVWFENFALMSTQVGFKVTKDIFEKWFGDKIQFFDGDKYFLKSFVDFQYGELKESNRAHAAVITLVRELSTNKPLISPLQGDKDKEKDKDKESSSFKEEFQNFKFEFGPNELATIWNNRLQNVKTFKGDNFPLVADLLPSQARYKAAKSRTQEKPNQVYWENIIDFIGKDEFSRGRNDRGWVADFMYLVRPDTHASISAKIQARKRPISPVIESKPHLEIVPELSDEERKVKALELRNQLNKVGLKMGRGE